MVPTRRVVLSTDVAETGLTIPTLRYVVDSGWMRKPEHIFGWDVNGLVLRPAPRANVTQRKGRAGRLFPGEFYPLYSESVYDSLPAAAPPALVSEPIGGYLLDIIAAQEGDFRPEKIDMLTPPPPLAFWEGISAAIVAGVLGPAGDTVAITPSGLRHHEFASGLDLMVWRLAISAPAYRLSVADLVTAGIAATELFRSVWGTKPGGVPPDVLLARTPLGKSVGAKSGAGEPSIRQLIRCEPAEIIAALEAFADAALAAGSDIKNLREWTESAGLNYDGLIDLARGREAAFSALLNAGVDPFWGDIHALGQGGPKTQARLARFRRALADIWRGRLLVWDRGAGSYRLGRGDRSAPLVSMPGPLSPALWGRDPPAYAVAGNLALVPRVQGRDRIHHYDITAAYTSALDSTPDDILYDVPDTPDDTGSLPRPSLAAYHALLDELN